MQPEISTTSAAHDPHSAEAVKKHVKVYVAVFLALLVLTGITVAASKLHLTPAVAVTVALAIAAVKGSLVAGFFMHLISERAVIYWVLAVCVVFFFALMLLPAFTDVEMVKTG